MKTGGWAGHAQQLHPPKKTHRIALWGKKLKNCVINAENSAHFGCRMTFKNQYFLSARRKTSFIWSDKFKHWTFLYSQQLSKQSLAILNLKIKKFKIRCMTSQIYALFLAFWPHCVSFCRKRMSISWGHSFYLLVLLSSTPLENFGLFSEHPIVMRCCWHPIYLFASTIIVYRQR